MNGGGGEATRFRKGNPGGPGRPKNLLRTDDVKRLLGRLWKMTKPELKSILEDPNAPMGELIIASIMARAAKEGDANRLNFLLDRGIGRIKDAPVEVKVEPFVVERRDGTQIVMGSKRRG